MSETEPVDPAADPVVDPATDPAADGGEKKERRRGGNRKPRKPKLKDWIRVVNSQGNGLPNQKIHIVVNEATGLVELTTQAAKMEGSTELEETRTQVFKIMSYEVVNDPTRDPLATIDADGKKIDPNAAVAEEPTAQADA